MWVTVKRFLPTEVLKSLMSETGSLFLLLTPHGRFVLCKINFHRQFSSISRDIYVTDSMPCSQEPKTSPGRKPGKSSPHSIIFLTLRYNIILTSTSWTFRRSFSFRLEKRKISRCLYQASLNNISTVGNCCKMVYCRLKSKIILFEMHLPGSDRQCQS